MATREIWQFRCENSILGPRLTGARKRGRGPWLRPVDLPAHVRDFFGLEPLDKLRASGGRARIMVEEKDFDMAALEKSEGVRWQTKRAKGVVEIPAPPAPPKRKPIPKGVPAIRSMADLCDFFSADEPRLLNHRIYRGTDCGASISIYLPDGTAIHNGSGKWDELTRETPIRGFTIQTIVEGSDAEVNSDEFVLPVRKDEVEHWMTEMEWQASALWERDNLDHFTVLHDGKVVTSLKCGWGDFTYACDEDEKDAEGPGRSSDVPPEVREAFQAAYGKRYEGDEHGCVKTVEPGEEIVVLPGWTFQAYEEQVW